MKTLVALSLIGFFAAPAQALVKTSFRFQSPPGWTVLTQDSAGAPATAAQSKAPAALLEQARSGQFNYFAADLASGADGFMENVNVIIQGGSVKITDSFVHQVATAIAGEAKKSGADYRVVEMGTSKIGSVVVGRYISELKLGELTVKQIGYLLPGKEEHAIVTYSTTPAEFAHNQPIFDRAALATVGVEEAPMFAWQSIVATGAALLLLVGYSIVAQRRRAK